MAYIDKISFCLSLYISSVMTTIQAKVAHGTRVNANKKNISGDNPLPVVSIRISANPCVNHTSVSNIREMPINRRGLLLYLEYFEININPTITSIMTIAIDIEPFNTSRVVNSTIDLITNLLNLLNLLKRIYVHITFNSTYINL